MAKTNKITLEDLAGMVAQGFQRVEERFVQIDARLNNHEVLLSALIDDMRIVKDDIKDIKEDLKSTVHTVAIHVREIAKIQSHNLKDGNNH